MNLGIIENPMEKKMEIDMETREYTGNVIGLIGYMYRGYIGRMEKKMETTTMAYVGIMEKRMEATIVGYIGIMKKTMETTIVSQLGRFRV